MRVASVCALSPCLEPINVCPSLPRPHLQNGAQLLVTAHELVWQHAVRMCVPVHIVDVVPLCLQGT